MGPKTKETELISEISGQPFAFIGGMLLVADSQRTAVETVLRGCGCVGVWSGAVSTVETYNDFCQGSGVSVWKMSLAKKEDAKKVQSALDDIK